LKNFRLLKANEIICRVQSATEKGVILLLYKDARCDMNILDETVGMLNWKRTHEFRDGKLYCTVSIYDSQKKEWISKEDVGVESNTDAEKGQASDSFKRACVNFGIGRELYTSPFIFFKNGDANIKTTNGKNVCRDIFKVLSIKYDENENILEVEILDKTTGVINTFKNDVDAPKKETKTKKDSKTDTTKKSKTEGSGTTKGSGTPNNEGGNSGVGTFDKDDFGEDYNDELGF